MSSERAGEQNKWWSNAKSGVYKPPLQFRIRVNGELLADVLFVRKEKKNGRLVNRYSIRIAQGVELEIMPDEPS